MIKDPSSGLWIADGPETRDQTLSRLLLNNPGRHFHVYSHWIGARPTRDAYVEPLAGDEIDDPDAIISDSRPYSTPVFNAPPKGVNTVPLAVSSVPPAGALVAPTTVVPVSKPVDTALFFVGGQAVTEKAYDAFLAPPPQFAPSMFAPADVGGFISTDSVTLEVAPPGTPFGVPDSGSGAVESTAAAIAPKVGGPESIGALAVAPLVHSASLSPATAAAPISGAMKILLGAGAAFAAWRLWGKNRVILRKPQRRY